MMAWQFVFPSKALAADRENIRRWHMSPAAVQKAMKSAVRSSGVARMES